MNRQFDHEIKLLQEIGNASENVFPSGYEFEWDTGRCWLEDCGHTPMCIEDLPVHDDAPFRQRIIHVRTNVLTGWSSPRMGISSWESYGRHREYILDGRFAEIQELIRGIIANDLIPLSKKRPSPPSLAGRTIMG
jgi:hypothetical protein